MVKNIIEFCLAANKLKNVIRTGWTEVEISSDRIESIAEHVYGCLVLAIGIESEINLNINMNKVFKMIVIKELEKTTLKELTTRNNQTEEERKISAFKTVARVTSSLVKQKEVLSLLEEYNNRMTKEAKFVYQLGKVESDLQAKIYDIEGNFDLNNAKEDAKYYDDELSRKIIPQMQTASDGWILYDRQYYTDKIFKELSNYIQKLKTLTGQEYEEKH